jgi:hypothetical protein
MPGDDHPGAAILLEPTHRPQPRLQPAMVDLDPSFGEQFLDVAVRRPRRRYQRTARTMTSGGKRKPAKTDRVAGAGRGRRGFIPAVSLPGHGRRPMYSALHATGTASEARPLAHHGFDHDSGSPQGVVDHLHAEGCRERQYLVEVSESGEVDGPDARPRAGVCLAAGGRPRWPGRGFAGGLRRGRRQAAPRRCRRTGSRRPVRRAR